MKREPRYRIMRVDEDADESQELIVPEPMPRTEWYCDFDGTRNDAWREVCAYCGRPREECEV